MCAISAALRQRKPVIRSESEQSAERVAAAMHTIVFELQGRRSASELRADRRGIRSVVKGQTGGVHAKPRPPAGINGTAVFGAVRPGDKPPFSRHCSDVCDVPIRCFSYGYTSKPSRTLQIMLRN